MDGPFAIAQVTPYPWEARREVNEYVASVSEALARRGHSVLVLAPSGSRPLVRDSRRQIRAAGSDPASLLEPGTAVRRRTTPGGGGPEPVARQLAAARARLAKQQDWLER